jgi:hypothetical protein
MNQLSNSLQKEINIRKNSGYKVIACVMFNHGQQQYFSDVIRLSIQTEKFFYFFVNEYEIILGDKLSIFKNYQFITQDEYINIKNIDLALHAEIYCRSPHVPEVCFSGHGFPGKHTVWSEENIKSFNHYFLYGPKDKKIFEFVTKDYSNEVTKHITFWPVGYPKYDCQFNTTEKQINTTKHEIGLDPKKPTILFAPAWDPRGILRTAGVELIKIFRTLKQYNFIIKLHPASMVDKKSCDYLFYTGGVDWLKEIRSISKKKIIKFFPSKSNLFIPKQNSINPLFKVSDLLITDFSGVSQGFFIEDKPVITIDCPEYFSKTLVEMGSDGELSKSSDLFNNGRRGTYILSDYRKIENAISEVLKSPQNLGNIRREIASELLYNHGKGTECMLNTIKSILKQN